MHRVSVTVAFVTPFLFRVHAARIRPSSPTATPCILAHPRPRPRPPSLAPATTITCINVPYSNPFPVPDLFSYPQLAFPLLAAPDVRPELLGAVLWTFGLYFGFSQRIRWAVVVNSALKSLFTSVIPSPAFSSFLADALHWVPFFASALLVDGLLRYAAAGNAVWAVSTGTSVALYAGVYELARQSVQASLLTTEERKTFDQFRSFAYKWLEPKGRCHFVDIKNKLRRESPTSQGLRKSTDEQIRRFVMNAFPDAKRSPNGFYRGLSVRQSPNLAVSQQQNDKNNSSNNISPSPSSSSSSNRS